MSNNDVRFNLLSSFVASSEDDDWNIKVIHIKGVTSLSDILFHLRLLGDKFIGAKGVSLGYDQGKNYIPKDQWVSCFSFGKGGEILFSRFLSGGSFHYNEKFHKDDWDGNLYILCCSNTKLRR